MNESGYTFREICKLWYDAKYPLIKYSTMCAYRLTLHVHLLPRFGEREEITEQDVQQFVLDKCAAGMSAKTVKDTVAVLKNVAKYGRKLGKFHFQEWEIRYPSSHTERRPLPILSVHNQRILVRHLTERPTPRNIGVLLALYTGMRIGEVCALKWEDVDLEQRTITVCHTVGRVYNCELKRTERIDSAPKTRNSYREIPISSQLFRALKVVRRQSQSPYVVGTSGRNQEPRAYRDYYNRLLKRLGIPRIVFHGLRHTFATRCIESQCDVKTVSALLGHANVATTLNLYVHPSMDAKKRSIEKMDKFLGINK